ncbi:MAG TPA: DegV family protein [Syntrophomonadaceae bacterium]|nr:DegV family protein [Syntrophomonadaceae bacterium]
MDVRIITDTSCDLPEEELDKYKIEMIPLKITFEDGETFLDRVEISPSLFVDKMTRSKTLPKTSAPDPDTFVSYFEKGLREAGQVLFVSLSSGLSSTYQTAVLARNMLGSQNICIFDSLTASLGTGIAAIKAAQMAALGLNVHTIVEQLSSIRKTREVMFTLDTLENVVKGGRLSRFQGLAGTVLNIKPILRGNSEGIPEIIDKVRGRKKAINRLASMLGEIPGPCTCERIIGISHVHCPEDAAKLARDIEDRYQPNEPIIIAEMGATIGTYAGTGGLMINL